jgi:hypothetical protein
MTVFVFWRGETALECGSLPVTEAILRTGFRDRQQFERRRHERALASLAESQKSECAGGKARGGGGLGQQELETQIT